MTEPRFLTTADVIAVHEQMMAAHGQSATALVRPEALESAVHSARNLYWYEEADVATIAVHLTIHIALALPWVDGNKRTAATAGIVLARYNGARQATSPEALAFADHLLAYIEAAHDDRETAFARFVDLVHGWFTPH